MNWGCGVKEKNAINIDSIKMIGDLYRATKVSNSGNMTNTNSQYGCTKCSFASLSFCNSNRWNPSIHDLANDIVWIMK